MLYDFGFGRESMGGSVQTENGGEWSGSLRAISRHFRPFPVDRLVASTRSQETLDRGSQGQSNDVLVESIGK